MIGALFYLLKTSWVNRQKVRLRRLKQPKYLIGAIFGGLYILYMLGMGVIASFATSRHHGRGFMSPENAQMFESLGALILFGLVLMWWVFPRERAALIFSEAEVAFLFPAPVTRRMLIHYKLVKSQVAIFFMIIILTIVFGRFLAGWLAWVRAIGWWVMLSTLNLHILAASFARTMLLERGVSNWKRRTIVLTLVGAAVVGVYIWAKQTIPPPDVTKLKGASDVEYYFEKVTESGPLPYLLYPFRMVVRPYIEGATGNYWGFLQALWPALLLMAAHYWWVMRADVAFEEASAEASRKMAERLVAMRANRGQWGAAKPKKKKRPPFVLRPTGAPAVGLFWKNLIAAGSAFTWRFWLFIAWLALPGGVVLATSQKTIAIAQILGPTLAMVLMMSFLIGPQMVRQDFRSDLQMADVLKTYPLRGWQMALGELLAPVAILTGFQWLALILVTTLLSQWEEQAIPLGARVAIALGVAIIAPGLNLVSLLIPNAAALLLPVWFQPGKDGPQQGIEVMGQRLVFMLGSMVAFVAAMVPATIVFGIIYFVGQMLLGFLWPVPIASAGALLVLGVESGFGLTALGKLFERYDVGETAS